jgi:hypothetical protein
LHTPGNILPLPREHQKGGVKSPTAAPSLFLGIGDDTASTAVASTSRKQSPLRETSQHAKVDGYYYYVHAAYCILYS